HQRVRACADIFLHLCFDQWPQQTAGEMSAYREAESLRDEEIDRAAGEESGRRNAAMHRTDEQQAEARSQGEKEEGHRRGDDAAADGEPPRKAIANMLYGRFCDDDGVGHGGVPRMNVARWVRRGR